LSTFEKIQWDLKYDTQIMVIDGQHRKLFDLYNRLVDLEDSNDPKLLQSAYEELLEYSVKHFTYEEHIMDLFSYSDFNTHIAEHKRFIETLKDLMSGNTAKAPLMGFLKHWLTAHIMEYDLDYGIEIFKG